mmetsp:Transcript_19888/g.50502  ORF Transcript_19888/g.50502 Transcript_19888/m.50502 type:complete len:373 (-) Transcript_19888:385-1503(-)
MTRRKVHTSSVSKKDSVLQSAGLAAADATRWWNVAFALMCIFGGCIMNNVFLESLIREDPGCGDVVTLAQFLFISIQGIFTYLLQWKEAVPSSGWSSLRITQRHLPISTYLLMVGIFFTLSFLNNLVFSFHIAMPLHMVFRSGSLVANMFMGFVAFGKRYPQSKVIGVLAVTAGILVTTLAASEGMTLTTADDRWLQWLQGLAIMFVTLLMSSLLGLIQENAYAKYGKHMQESMFYSHALALPLFGFFASRLWETVVNWTHVSDVYIVGGVALPKMYTLLAANVLTQYICVKGVFGLIGATSSLTCTMALSVRKFVSLALSVVLFGNEFTIRHWIGALLVFVGTLVYSLMGTTDGSASASSTKEEPGDKKTQ